MLGRLALYEALVVVRFVEGRMQDHPILRVVVDQRASGEDR